MPPSSDMATPPDNHPDTNPCTTHPGVIAIKSVPRYVNDLQHGMHYEPLTSDQSMALRDAAAALAAGDSTGALSKAAGANYQVQLFRSGSDGACYWALVPGLKTPAGHAVLLMATSYDRNLIIEAPHVPNDLHTDDEAAAVFIGTKARTLLIAGANRCAVTTPSNCSKNTECNQNGIAVESDPCHSLSSAFHAMHTGLTVGTSAVAIQFHTNLNPMLNGAAMVSNGTRYPIADTAADKIFAALTGKVTDIRTCNDAAHPAMTGTFCGETNAQSLTSNGVSDVCTGTPPHSGGPDQHRFVHIEQDSKQLSADVNAWSQGITNAIVSAIPVR